MQELAGEVAAAQDACSASQQSLEKEKEEGAERARVLSENASMAKSSAQTLAATLAGAEQMVAETVARLREVEKEKEEALAAATAAADNAAAAAAAADQATAAAMTRQRELEKEKEEAVAAAEGVAESLREEKVRRVVGRVCVRSALWCGSCTSSFTEAIFRRRQRELPGFSRQRRCYADSSWG